MKRAFLPLFLLPLLAACPSDEAAPGKPVLDALPAVTSLQRITVSGQAEYFAKIQVTNGAVSIDTQADGDSGRFAVEVSLTEGDNAIEVVAMDAAGNKSEAATANVVRELPRAEVIRISLEDNVINTDEAQLAVQVQVRNDEPEIDLGALEVTLRVEGYGASISAVHVDLDASGAGRATLMGFDVAGVGRVVATSDIAAADGSVARAEQGFVVVEGAPVALSLLLSADPPAGHVGPAADISVPPATVVTALVTVTDSAGNEIPHAPLALEVQNAQANIVGEQIRDLTRAGRYRVVVSIPADLIAAEATLTVLPGQGSRIELSLSAASMQAGDTQVATALVYDDYDNLVSGATPTLSHDVPATDNQGNAQAMSMSAVDGGSQGSIEVRSAGQYTVTASLTELDDASASFSVAPGAATDGTIAVNPDPLVAGEILQVTPSFVDVFGNTTHAGFRVATDAPGALVVGDRVYGITKSTEGLTPYRLLLETDFGQVLERVLDVVSADPSRISVSVTPDTTVAGEQTLVQAEVLDLYGNRVRSLTPVVTEAAPADFATQTTIHGLTRASLTETQAGVYTVSADAASLTTAHATLTVVPGPIASANIAVSPDPLVAGETLTISPTFSDAYGNAIVPTYSVATDAPGAIVLGNRIIGITRSTEGGSPYNLYIKPEGGLVRSRTLGVVAAAAERVQLSLSDGLVQAGAAVSASAEITDRFGNRVRATPPSLTEDAPQDFAPAPTSVDGVTTGTITVTAAGNYLVTATDPSSAAAPASVRLNVQAAEPVNANFFELDPAGLPYLAGDSVGFTYSFTDAYGNANTSVPIVVTVNAPNVVVTDNGDGTGQINGIVRTGSYTATARALGTGLNPDAENLSIGPNPINAGFNLLLSTGLLAQGGTALMFVSDGFGNNIDVTDVTVTPSDASISQAGNQLTFALPGTYSITACLVADSSVCDTEYIGVQGILDTVPPQVSVTIITPDPGTTSFVNQRGIVAYRVDLSDDRGLSQVDVIASFGDGGGCTRTDGPVYLSGGTTSRSLSFSFKVPGCALPLDSVNIVARAVDEAGNSRNSSPHSALNVADVLTNVASPGFVTSFAAWQDKLQGNNPYDVAVNPQTGELYISVQGNNRIVAVPFDRVQYDLRDQWGNKLDSRRPRGVVFDSAGNFFFNAETRNGNNPALERLRSDYTWDSPLVDQTVIAAAYPSDGFGLALEDAAGLTPLICAAVRNSNRVQCFKNFSNPVQTPSMPINQVITGGAQPLSVVFAPPSGLHAEDFVYVLLNNAPTVKEYTLNAARDALTFVRDIDLSAAGFGGGDAQEILVAPNTENLIISDIGNGRVVSVDRVSGNKVRDIVTGLQNPIGLAWDGASLLVVDQGIDAVLRITPDPLSPGTF